eukprot:756235-Pyramimonas_sp.AAC.1
MPGRSLLPCRFASSPRRPHVFASVGDWSRARADALGGRGMAPCTGLAVQAGPEKKRAPEAGPA